MSSASILRQMKIEEMKAGEELEVIADDPTAKETNTEIEQGAFRGSEP